MSMNLSRFPMKAHLAPQPSTINILMDTVQHELKPHVYNAQSLHSFPSEAVKKGARRLPFYDQILKEQLFSRCRIISIY